MELQWPLIIFTALVSWSAGLFAMQCYCALKGEARAVQMPAWIVSAVLLAVGGIAVFFHLEHWERIFNGFGHLSSGITQELIAIVVLGIVAIIYLVMLRKAGDDADVPKWVAILGIVASAILLLVMAHSYMMAARPAWDTFFWILVIFGNACAFGPATMLLLVSIKDHLPEESVMEKLLVVGTSANAVTTLAYVIAAAIGTSALFEVGYYFDHVHPTNPILEAAQFGPFGDALFATLVAVVVAACAVVAAFFGKKKNDWKTWSAVALACVLVAAVAIRIAFYQMGASVFMIF